MSLKERLQVLAPRNNNEDKGENEWVWPFRNNTEVRKTGEAGFLHSNNSSADAMATAKFNFLPPGMELDNQKRVRINQMPLSMSGQSDVSKDTNPTAFAEGFTRRDLGSADDQYHLEHVDLFYGAAVGDDGNEGFVERNNYLDRL